MSSLSQDQLEKRASIQKTATIWGVGVAVVAGLIALWALGGQGAGIRYGGAAVIALIAGFLVRRASFNSGAKSAKCPQCGAAFSRSRTDSAETLASSEAKEEREQQDDKSTKVTTWTAETYDVLDTYTCAKCGATETKSYQTTRRRDEETVIEPYEPPASDASAKSDSITAASGKSAASGKAAASGKSGRRGKSSRG